MALSVGELQVILSGDTRKLNQDLDRLDARAGKTEQVHTASWKRIAVTAGAALAALGAADFFRDSIAAASDLNETLNKSNVIFGANAAEVNRWAQGSAKNFGLSKQAALEAASSFGNMLQQLGFTGDQAVDASTNVVKLAADLGSFNNLDTGDVLDRIGAAMRGEYDSLQLLIPNINAARVEQEAMAETGKKNAGQLTAQEKAAATLAIVQRDGAAAANDFAETSDGLANSAKITAAQFEDLKAKVGQAFLPAAQTTMHFLSGTAIPVLGGVFDVVGGLAGAFADLPGPVLAGVGVMTALVLVNGPLAGAIGRSTLALASWYGQAIAASGATGVLGATMVGVRGAATGLMGLMGGPLGLAITGVTVGLGFLMSALSDTEETTDDTAASQSGLAQALMQSKGAIDANVRAAAAKAAQDKGILDAAGAAGVSLSLVTDAILGQGNAYNEVMAKLVAYRDAHTDLNGERTGEAQQVAAAITALQGLSGQTDVNIATALQLATATGETATSTGTATVAAQDWATELEGASTAASEAKKQTDLLKLSLDMLTGAHVDLTDAEAAMYDAVDAADGAVKGLTGSVLDNAGQLNTQSEAGRKAQDVLHGIRDAGDQYIATLMQQGATADEAMQADRRLRESFIGSARQMGLSEDAANRLADEILGIPAERETKIRADTQPATDAANALKSLLASIHDRVVTITARAVKVGDFNGIGSGTGRMGTFASGGQMPARRLALVGEQGPELLFPDRAAYVATAQQTAAILAASGQQASSLFAPTVMPDYGRMAGAKFLPSAAGGISAPGNGRSSAAAGQRPVVQNVTNRNYTLNARVDHTISMRELIAMQREADALYG